MAHSHAQIVAWLLPLVAPVAPALRDTAHHEVVDQRLEALQAAAQCGLEGLVAVEAAMTAIRLKPGEAPPALTGAQLIAEESHRVRAEKGITVEEDAETYSLQRRRGELAKAAAAYAIQAGSATAFPFGDESEYRQCEPSRHFPWSILSWKPESPRADLIKAGQLIAAQIDLLDYLEAQKAKESAA
jgi:hypothetical protein